jgi:CheY-like chemotaxis protein
VSNLRIFVICSEPNTLVSTLGREIAMLQGLSEEIRLCYRRAEHFARMAKAAPTETLRADCLRHERCWLELARGHELQQRLTRSINDTRKRETGDDFGIRRVDANGAAGATAWVELPAPSKTGDGPKHVQDGLIAIVDDDDCVRDGLSALIESLGRRAATFTSAEDYLASAAKANTACLILDVHLPGMSGPDLQAHLIAEGCCPPTVFVTGRFEERAQHRVIAAGALGYLSKPCDEKTLFDCIEKAGGAMRSSLFIH